MIWIDEILTTECFIEEGTIYYAKNKKIEDREGIIHFLVNNKWHREDGPAVIYFLKPLDFRYVYYLNGECVTPELKQFAQTKRWD